MASGTMATISCDAQLGDAPVAELDDLSKVVAGVDMQHRERNARRPERLLGEAQHHDRVLAAGEHERRALELGSHLAEDVDRLGLQGLELGESVVGHDQGAMIPGKLAAIVRDRWSARASTILVRAGRDLQSAA